MNSKNDNKKELLYAGALKLSVISFFEEDIIQSYAQCKILFVCREKDG